MVVRWDSPLVLMVAGTAAIHTILVVFVDAMIVTHPLVIPPRAPHIEMFEVKVLPPVIKKIAPVQARIEPQPVKPVAAQPRPRIREPQVENRPQPVPVGPTSPDSGGSPVLNMPDLAPDAHGTVPIAAGGPRVVRPGTGGSGTGTGSGSGSGSGSAPPPVSIATIKTRALPKGDYGYIDASRDYPAEARQMGVEGPIRVRLIVDAKGKVAAAVLLNKLGHGLDELALDRAKKIEFDPAKDTDDHPVTSVVIWTFNMTLPKK